MADPEPKRPPPPKSYVPLLLLDDEPTPALPPRPKIEGEDASSTVANPNSDHTPSNMSPQPSPVPRPRTNSHSRSRNGSESPVPIKPERRKNKKNAPPPPAPYMTSGTDKDQNSTDPPTVKPYSPQPARRHTHSGAKLKLKTIDTPGGSIPHSQPILSPPDILPESLYSEVKKPKRYPAPNVPAPPPPYTGELPVTHNGHVEAVESIQERSSPPQIKKRVSSPTERPKESVSTSSKGQTRPVKTPPSRPSRPPAVSPPPGGGVSSPTHSLPSPIQRSTTLPGNTKPTPIFKKRGAKPEITVVSAQPMDSNIIPSPPLSPQYDQPLPKHVPTTKIRQPPPRRPVSIHGGALDTTPVVKSPSQPRKSIQTSAESSLKENLRSTRSMSLHTSRLPPPHPSNSPNSLRKSISQEKKADHPKVGDTQVNKSPKLSKSAPPRPVGRPPPPHPTSRPKKGPIVDLGPPPEEEPPEPPTDEEGHEAKVEEQGTAPNAETKLSVTNSLEQPEASGEQVSQVTPSPTPSKRRSKFEKPPQTKDDTSHLSDDKQSSPKTTPKHPAPGKRPPPPRPGPGIRPINTLTTAGEDHSSSGSEKLHEQSEQSGNKSPPKRPKRHPTSKHEEQHINDTSASVNDPTAPNQQVPPTKPQPRRPPSVKRPPPPRHKQTSEKTGEDQDKNNQDRATGTITPPGSDAVTTSSEQTVSEPPTKPHPRPVKRSASSEQKDVELLGKMDEQPSSGIQPTTSKDDTTASHFSIDIDTPESDKTTPKQEPSTKPQPKRPPTVRRPPPPKQKVASEKTHEVTQSDKAKDDGTVSPTNDVVTTEIEQTVSEPPTKPQPKRPPTVKRPPPPKQKEVVALENTDELHDKNSMPSEDKTTSVSGEQLVSTTNDQVSTKEETPTKPHLKRPPAVKRPPPPKNKDLVTVEKSEEVVHETVSDGEPETSVSPLLGESTSTADLDETSPEHLGQVTLEESSEVAIKPQPKRPSIVKRSPPPKQKKTTEKTDEDTQYDIKANNANTDEVPSKSEQRTSEPPTKPRPKRPPTVKRPPPPKQKDVETMEKQDDDNPVIQDIQEDPTSSVDQNEEVSTSDQVINKEAPPKRPPTVKRPPPPNKTSKVETNVTAKEDESSADPEVKQQIIPNRSVKRPPPPKKTEKAKPEASEEVTTSNESEQSVETPNNKNDDRPPKKLPSKRPPPPRKAQSLSDTAEMCDKAEHLESTELQSSVTTEVKAGGESQDEQVVAGETHEEKSTTVAKQSSTVPPKKPVKRPPPPKKSTPSRPLSVKRPPPPAQNISASENPSTPKNVAESEAIETQIEKNVTVDSMNDSLPQSEEQQPVVDDSVPTNSPTTEASGEDQETNNTQEQEEEKPIDVETEESVDPPDEATVVAESESNSEEDRVSSPEPIVATTTTAKLAPKRPVATKSMSALTKKPSNSSVNKKQAEEEGGIRIIRYDKRESTFEASTEDSGVMLRDKSTKPKPPRPVSMPPGKVPGKKDSPSIQRAGTQRSKPGRPPPLSLHTEKPPPSRPKPPKPTPPAGPERPKPPRPGGRPTPTSAKGPAPSKPTGPARPPVHKPAPSSRDPSRPPKLPPRPTPGHPLYRYVCTEPHGLAITHYEAHADDELSYMKNDVIEFIEKVDDNWYYARNADMDLQEGLVLSRNLKIIKKMAGSNTVKGFEDGPCAIAMHTFNAQSMDELSFNDGDLIMLKTRVGKDWLRGKLISGAEGIFPKSYVEIVEDLPPGAMEEVQPEPVVQQHTSAQSTVDRRDPHCVALHPFNAESPDELSLSPGDVINLLERNGDWLKGSLAGKEGIFPAGFVEVKVDLPPTVEKKKVVPETKKKTATLPSHVVTGLFDYDGQEGDLSFKANDKIKLIYRVNEEWVFGEQGGKKGMLPVSFINSNPDTLPLKEDVETKEKSPETVKVTGECEALFDFEGDVQGGELKFKQGDIITTTEWVNAEWMSGRVGTKEGMFPINFAKVIKELPVSKDPAKTPSSSLSHVTKVTDDLMPRGIATYSYDADNTNEISFKEGDTLYLLTRVSDEWYEGENTRTGTLGQFPASYVNVVVPLP